MSMPVWVGVVLAIIFLTTFSGWFYGIVFGMKELVLDDKFFAYRIGAASIVSVLIFVGAFWGIATINECQQTVREGIFTNLSCDDYSKIKLISEEFFQR